MDDIATSLYTEDDYGDIPAAGIEENKAKRSQFDANEPVRGENAPALRACK